MENLTAYWEKAVMLTMGYLPSLALAILVLFDRY